MGRIWDGDMRCRVLIGYREVGIILADTEMTCLQENISRRKVLGGGVT